MPGLENNRIRELRDEKKWSQQKLAEALSVHQTAVSQWEKGSTRPEFEALDKMCSLFDVSLDYILGRTSERGHLNLTEAEQDELGRMAIADYDHEHFERYKKLDSYGKAAVDAVTGAELERMKDQQEKPF